MFYILLAIVTGIALTFLVREISADSDMRNDFQSRFIMEQAMDFVRKEKPTPPVAAIFYAKVSEDIYLKSESEFDSQYFNGVLSSVLETESKLVKVTRKIGNEKNEYWVGENPFSPNIGSYPRFLLKNFSYQVPVPPVYGSDEFKEGLAKVKQSAKERTSEQNALVNFYGGVPGTEGPAGIWQNIFWENVKSDPKITEQDFSYMQMILAKSVADGFLECWNTKYIYQTKRPNMTDESIDLAMPNPPFPGYVSGHSTISFVAANILSNLVSEKKSVFMKHAEQARDSRLWAGIHFLYDNSEGQRLGEEVAKNILENISH